MQSIITKLDKLPNWAQSFFIGISIAVVDYAISGTGVTWQGLLVAIVAAVANWLTTQRAALVSGVVPAVKKEDK